MSIGCNEVRRQIADRAHHRNPVQQLAANVPRGAHTLRGRTAQDLIDVTLRLSRLPGDELILQPWQSDVLGTRSGAQW